ncbi:multiheme c-type cytochrome [Vibrio hippocampi]|uniref:Cytochrome c-552/4 domain-containing protein n=1 Tax=Vibrio hippocampi TaxID=654686 RepID=A0ABN8DJY3_9VIBR|nr:multiheme c-type cytochrome [Vibrio hippocampi]CAH0529656.1 hypothetical protein VHP8226_03411 [Vibrio hippocampi]
MIKQCALILALGVLTFTKALGASQVNSDGFVGSQVCIDCHQEQAQAWKGSDHERAMDHATSDSVLGDFNDASITHNNQINRFFKVGQQFWVTLEGPDGRLVDHQIAYTFGHYPLQQYMVEFADGRVQLIPFAWDSRTETEGGQRWFHLYPDTTPQDEFYWTNTGQNWNFMCADCHSTNLKKNYDDQTNRYNTTWSEITVGCEACHGPGERHVNLAKQTMERSASGQSEPKQWDKAFHYGFDRQLAKTVQSWVFQQGHKTLQPQGAQDSQQLDTCAQCHSRRVQLNEKGDPITGHLLDRYLISNITPELYHLDGQIYDEVYVYGSFMQSKMAQQGVTCTNCHDPHSAKLAIPEQAVCLQCHVASEYSAEKHTFHSAGSEADQCTSCHMPETTYMQVDPRRDHSWHVPRPDLSEHLGTPNVCTQCHDDNSNTWAMNKLKQWYPNSQYQQSQHFAVAFYAHEIGHQGAENALAYIAQNHNEAAIIRSSALQKLGRYQGNNTLITLGRAVQHQDATIRLGAIQGSAAFDGKERWQILQPLLTDPVAAVRAETAGALVAYWSQLNPQQKQALAQPLQEYIEIQQFNSDRGFGRTNLGNIYASQKQWQKAITAYQGAITIEPYFANSYVNLAEVYRQTGKQKQAVEVLKLGASNIPNSGAIQYSTGLALIRTGDATDATHYFSRAAELEPNNAQYWYVYALATQESKPTIALNAFDQAFRVSSNPEHLYAKCQMMVNKKLSGATQCIDSLTPYAPPEVIKQLKQQMLP